MALGFFERFPSQRDIEAVVRTNPANGTTSFMVRRGLLNSMRSALPWRNSSLFGLPAVRHAGMTLHDIDAVLDSGSPVIVLQHFDISAISPGDGHFRVVVAHDRKRDEWTLLDPWDRDNWPRVVRFNSTAFLTAWSITEVNEGQSSQFVGVYVVPLRVSVTGVAVSPTRVHVAANVTFGVGADRLPPLVGATLTLGLPRREFATLDAQSVVFHRASAAKPMAASWTVTSDNASIAGLSVRFAADIESRVPNSLNAGAFESIDVVGGESNSDEFRRGH